MQVITLHIAKMKMLKGKMLVMGKQSWSMNESYPSLMSRQKKEHHFFLISSNFFLLFFISFLIEKIHFLYFLFIFIFLKNGPLN